MDLQNSMLEEAKRDAGKEISAAESELQKEIAAAQERLSLESRGLAAAISTKILGRTCQ
jgi:F0F1-type ATP synthase membrane subunit b/b'